jgi:hypothetical protein
MKGDRGKGSGDAKYRGGKRGGEKGRNRDETYSRERGERMMERDREDRHTSIDEGNETWGKRRRDED